jgi:SAM-dependent methyltransferase
VTQIPKPAHLGPEFGAQFSDTSVAAAYHHRPPYPDAVFPLLAGLVRGSPCVVLDAGCGTGDIARFLAPLVDRVDAVDISAPMIAVGRTLPGGDEPRLRWIQGRMEDTELGGPYGLITAGESLHWMEWSVVLPRFCRLLTEGGVLAIVSRQGSTVPWGDALQETITRFSTNRLFQPYDLMAELEQRHLFAPLGQESTEPVLVQQTVDSYIESIHSRNGFSRDRMTTVAAQAFDQEVASLLAPHAVDGVVSFHHDARVVWGAPLDG